MPSTPFFSIIIPSLNEEKYLPHLLTDLTKQTNQDFEVIHVDGTSEDRTVEKAKQFADKLKMQTIVVTKRNVSYQRNRGVEFASGKWIIFMDADNRLPKYFLDGVRYQIAKSPSMDVFTTWMKSPNSQTIYSAIEKIVNFGIELYKFIGKEVAIGALIGAKKAVCNKIKFDETQKIFEDAFFIRAAIDNKYQFKILREPRYFLSFRRQMSDGMLKTIGMTAVLNVKQLQGKSFENEDFGYTMVGGANYKKRRLSVLGNLDNFLKKASKSQLKQAKEIWHSITNDLKS